MTQGGDTKTGAVTCWEFAAADAVNSSYQKKRGDRASTNATSPTSPTPQNLKDNPERLAKVKTEMCRYFELGGIKNCPWGDNCKSSTHVKV